MKEQRDKTNAPKPADEASGPDANATLKEFEKLVADLAQPRYLFRLYVAGSTQRSSRAIDNVRRICEQYLAGRFDLEVIDVYQQADAAKRDQVIALPTLIKDVPLPTQRFVGDMSDTERIVIALDLRR